MAPTSIHSVNDLRLWQLLDPTQYDASQKNSDELKALLQEFSQVAVRQRMPYLHRLNKLHKHDDSELRRLHFEFLSGVAGWKSWATLLDGTNDPSPTIRSAAIQSLIESAKASGWLLCYLIFHEDPSVRAETISRFAEKQQRLPSRFLHLLSDNKIQNEVGDAVERFGVETDVSTKLLIRLHQCGMLKDDLARQMVSRLPVNRLANYLVMTGGFSEQECDRIIQHRDRIPIDMFTPENSAFDEMLWLLELFWDCEDHQIETMATSASASFESKKWSEDFLQKWWTALRDSPEKFAKRAAACAKILAQKTDRWNDSVFGYCVAAFPELLIEESIPRDVRRRAGKMLYRLKNEIPEADKKTFISLLKNKICRRESGHLDLWLIGAILNYSRGGGLGTLLECYKTSQIVSAFLAAPDDSLSFFSYSGSVEQRQRLLDEIRSKRSKMSLLIDAMLVHVVPVDGLQFLDRLNSQESKNLLLELLSLQNDKGLKLSKRKKTGLVSSILGEKLELADLRDFMNEWLGAREPKAFMIGLELISVIARSSVSASNFLSLASSLHESQLGNLLSCIERSAGFPYGVEVQLAKNLVSHSNPTIRDWGLARAPSPIENRSEPNANEHPEPDHLSEDGVKFCTLSEEMAKAIATCHETDLIRNIGDCLKAPSRGLCAALAQRPDPSKPTLDVVVALLGSADPIEEVDVQIARFGSNDRRFLENLDGAVCRTWQAKDHLPLLCNAWLHRWERHAFAYSAQAMNTTENLLAILRVANRLANDHLSESIWRATHTVLNLWRFRFPDEYASFVDSDLLTKVIQQLTLRHTKLAAKILMSAFDSRRLLDPLTSVRPLAVELLPELKSDVRKILQPWLDSRGISQHVSGRKKPGEVAEELVQQINRAIDIEPLMNWCRHHDVGVVTNAALRCVALEGRWLDAMIQLLQENPSPVQATVIAETVSLWPESHLPFAIELMGNNDLGSATRFLIGLNLIESGESVPLDDVLQIACEEASPSWLQRDDVQRLTKLAPTERYLATRLATSPHPHAYRFAINELIERDENGNMIDNDETPPEVLEALRNFLECGSERLRNLRMDAAVKLQRHGDFLGYPLILESLSEGTHLNLDKGSIDQFPDAMVEESVSTGLLAGGSVFPESKLLNLLPLGYSASENAASAAILLNEAAVSNRVRQALAHRMRPSLSRSQKLRDVAEAFAWGIPVARELTGRLFTIEMIGGDDHGYTRLHENKISINPLAILQRKPNGRKVVEGLILHELGHHLYHRGPSAEEIWERANQEKVYRILNLVSDEHLERNLRALDRSFGDRLKKLGAHVFQHTAKEVHFENLVDALNVDALDVLSNSRMKIARQPGCVRLSTRRVMNQLERHGSSFIRFFRALRLGLGNRFDDPKVAEALELFRKDFRNSSMKRLYEITIRIREIFGDECSILDCLSQDSLVEGEGSQILIDGEGISNHEVQSVIRRITSPPKGGSGGGGPRCINVSDSIDFPPINSIQRVTASPAEHAKYANQVVRHANQLRKYLSELGLVMVPQRRRIRGRSLDRPGLQKAILKGDPRMLVLRETRFETDLFVGVAIDCSGSMKYDDNIEKAKLFGALLSEAVRGMPSIDLRIFGFTDEVIFDAGNADRPGLANLKAGGGNNDAAALLHAAQQAQLSRRRAKLLVMISDGLPTECSVAALRSLVNFLTRRKMMCCAQVAVQPLEEICFPNHVLLDTNEPSVAVREFGSTIARLVRKSMNQAR